MEDELLKCLEELRLIRKYLIKKGKSRFKGNVIKNKLLEVEIIYEKSKELIQLCTSNPSIKSESLTSLCLLNDDIKSCYLHIIDLCSPTKQGSDSELSESSNPELIMEFDLKTACSLIPVMNNNENNIRSIIDSVEMYADMLSESGKKLLVKFVLKSRLSENAKLRMSHDYISASDFVKDLRDILLPKKSFTALQSRLQNATQGWRTIDQYGTELEKIFTNLTISQADGNTGNYGILKPLNEKMAIKRFADGLRDSRLSTIIAARNYNSLKDAIQAAKDEELTAASTSTGEENVMHFSRRGRGKWHAHNSNYRQTRGWRGNSHYQNQNNFGNNFIRGRRQHTSYDSGRGNANFARGRSFNNSRGNGRGTYKNFNRGRGHQVYNENRSSYETHSNGNNHRVFYNDESDRNDFVTQKPDEMQFFRSQT